MAARASSLRKIVRLVGAFVFIAGSVSATPPQGKAEKAEAEQQDFPKRCNPIFVRKPRSDGRKISVRKGDKSTGYGPLVTFQIAESGEVINIHLKRSSGFKDIDDLALSWVKSGKYNSRPGCPVIDVEESVMVDF
jgi:TonB family protein